MGRVENCVALVSPTEECRSYEISPVTRQGATVGKTLKLHGRDMNTPIQLSFGWKPLHSERTAQPWQVRQ